MGTYLPLWHSDEMSKELCYFFRADGMAMKENAATSSQIPEAIGTNTEYETVKY